MLKYGAYKKAEIGQIEINRIFRKNKKGIINVHPQLMDNLFTLASYYGFDDNGAYQELEEWAYRVSNLLEDKNYKEAQFIIDLRNERYTK